MHYNRYRYYLPYVGRFISKDPIGLLGGLNTFAYAPNPVGWVDSLGLSPSSVLDKNLGGMVGDKMQAHHVIPVEKWKTHSKFLTEIGLGNDRDKASNGILMPDSCNKAQSMRRLYYHCSSHTIYSARVEAQMIIIKNQYTRKLINAQQAKEKIENLQDDLRTYLAQSSSAQRRLN